MSNARAIHPLQGGRSAASLTLEPLSGSRVRPLELLRFLPFCAWLVLGGFLDVVRRALHPRGHRGSFGQLETRCRLPRGSARLFFLEKVSLVPGAFAAESKGDCLTLHLLDASPGLRAACLASVRELEARVARVFGLPPPPRGVP
jgi:multicomponent Na+:H+ antiporter subunit E